MADDLTRERVERIAALGALSLSEGEVEAERARLGAVLGYVERLGELDLEGVEPLAQIGEERGKLREDEPGATLDPERVAELAPAAFEVADGDGGGASVFIRVPKVIDGGGGGA